jgi:hypothetical protein
MYSKPIYADKSSVFFFILKNTGVMGEAGHIYPSGTPDVTQFL